MNSGRLMSPAHLIAAEHARLVRFVEAGTADPDRLRDILARHSLFDGWAAFEKRFLQP